MSIFKSTLSCHPGEACSFSGGISSNHRERHRRHRRRRAVAAQPHARHQHPRPGCAVPRPEDHCAAGSTAAGKRGDDASAGPEQRVLSGDHHGHDGGFVHERQPSRALQRAAYGDFVEGTVAQHSPQRFLKIKINQFHQQSFKISLVRDPHIVQFLHALQL